MSIYTLKYKNFEAELSDDIPNDPYQPKGTGKAKYRIGSIDDDDWVMVDCAGWPDLERIVKRKIDEMPHTDKGAGNR